jgi:hypothetical protein
MNEVRYTDNESTLELWLDEGFVLEPEFEPDKEPTDGEGGVGDKNPETEPTDGEGKKATKSTKK